MKHIIYHLYPLLLLLIIVHSTVLCANDPANITLNINLPAMNQTTHTQAQPTTHIDYKNDNRPVTSLESQTSTLHNAAITNTSAINNAITISTVVTATQHLLNTLKQQLDILASTTTSGWQNHGYKGLSILFLGIYTAIVARILYDNHFIQSATRWGNWNCAQNSIAAAAAIHTDEVTHQLLVEIQRRYMVKNDPTNFMTPIISFLHDIDTEALVIKRYLWYSNYLNKPVLRYILPTFYQDKAKLLLERTELVRTLFIQWMAKQNIVKHTVTAQTF